MRFDSHVADLLRVSVGLVNLGTCELAGGRPAPALPAGERRQAMGELLARDGNPVTVSAVADRTLARFAQGARPVFEAVADEDQRLAAEATNALLGWTRPEPRLDPSDGGWHLHFHGRTDGLGDGWAAGCATALAMAIGSPLAGRLGVCEAPSCDRVYVDRSKNGTRRFCQVTCQNRVKNAAFRTRHP